MPSYLDSIQSPSDLKRISLNDLPKVCDETRTFILESVSKSGGHLASSLGSVELTVALHYVLNSPQDRILWDVGHQTYTHKILTGRKDRLSTLRRLDGLSGFPSPQESDHDPFAVGHASTAIAQALGLAVARDWRRTDEKIVAVVGDGSLTGGLAFEALNNAGQLKKNIFVVLNDNKMSIAQNVGAISQYLNRLITSPTYNRIRDRIEGSLKHFPRLKRIFKSWEEAFKSTLVPGVVFEELGLRYFGPFDGHNVVELVKAFEKMFQLKETCLIHVLTQKGKGYRWAEAHPAKYHSCGQIDLETGEKPSFQKEKLSQPRGLTYTQAFSNCLIRLAQIDSRVVAITAAMAEGTGLDLFQKLFPDRLYDVGIAEGFALTFAGALSKGGLKPVCSIYSTFLQRAYDQMIHDVALQRSNVTLCIDRAGCVGPDGATHQGLYDFHYLRGIPGSVVSSPKNEGEMDQLLRLAVTWPGLFGIRYPKAVIPNLFGVESRPFGVGEGEVLHEGDDLLLVSLGSMVEMALQAAAALEEQGLHAAVLNLRFVKPLDETLLANWIKRSKWVYTVEDHALTGGLGSALLEFFERRRTDDVRLRRFAFPDQFIEHGEREEIMEKYGLSSRRMAEAILYEWKLCRK